MKKSEIEFEFETPVARTTIFGVVLAVAMALAVLLSSSHGAGVGGSPGSLGNGGIILQSGVTNGVLYPNTPWTNAINTNTTMTNPTRFYVPDTAHEVIFEVTFQETSAGVGNSNVVVTAGRSVNGGLGTTNYDSILTWPVAANGTTQVIACTNLSAWASGGANPYWYIVSIQHLQTNAGCLLTNFTVRAYAK